MKLNEIIQSNVYTSTSPTLFDADKQSKDFHNDVDKINFNRGSYSYITPSNNPFEIKKKSIIAKTDKNDPFFKFATFLMDNDLMNTNPFFPRIYDIETQKDENGLRIYDATIELLQPLSVMNRTAQNTMAHMLIDIDEIIKFMIPFYKSAKDIEDKLYHEYHEKLKSKSLAMLFEAITLILTNVTDLLKYIKNDELVIALKALLQFKNINKNIVGFDIHDENFMVRQGNTGYQLVLNDPIASNT